MSDALAKTKSTLRGEVRARLRAMSPEELANASTHLVSRILATPMWKNADSVLLFSPLQFEPDINPLLREALAARKLTALPWFDATTQSYSARWIIDADRDLTVAKFGILEPRSSCHAAPLNRLDLVLVPGVAFDAQGRRLGRGKGFYDRLLAHVRGTKCGVGFDEQIVEAIPVAPLDVTLNCILTPTRWTQT